MKEATAKQVLDIQEWIRSNQTLMSEHESTQVAFLEMLSELTSKQQDILMDYLGVCVEIHLQMLERAIEMK